MYEFGNFSTDTRLNGVCVSTISSDNESEKLKKSLNKNSNESDCFVKKIGIEHRVIYPIGSIGYDVHIKWHDDDKKKGSFKSKLHRNKSSVHFFIEDGILICW